MAKFVNQFQLDLSNFFNGLKTAKKKAEELGGISPDIRLDVDDKQLDEAKSDINKLDGKVVNVKIKADTKDVQKSASAFAGVFGGALAGGALSGGLQTLGTKLFESAKTADALGDNLQLAFSQAGLSLAEQNKQLEESDKWARSLSDQYAISATESKALLAQVVGISGFTGKTAQDYTKLSIGIEKASGGLIKAEVAAKVLAKGVDPENAEAVEALAKRFPQLADALKSTAPLQDKLAAGNEALTGTFTDLERQAKGPTGALDRLSQTFEQLFQDIANPLFQGLAPVFDAIGKALTPLLQAIVPVITEISGVISSVFKEISGPVLQGLTTAIKPVVSLLQSLLPVITQIITTALKPLSTAISIVAEILGDVLNPIIEALKPLLTTIGKVFETLSPVLVKIVTTGLAPFQKIIASLMPLITMLVKQLAGRLIVVIEALLPVFVEVVEAVTEISNVFREIFAEVISTVIEIITELIGSTDGAIDTTKIFKTIIEALMVPLKLVVAIVRGLADALNFVKIALIVVIDAIGEFLKAVASFNPARIIEAISNFGNIGEDIAKKFADSKKSVKETTDAVEDQTGAVDANTLAAEKNEKVKTDGAKSTETALAKATKEYQKQNAEIVAAATIEKQRVELLKKQGILTEKIANSKIAEIDAAAVAKSVALAKKVFQAEVDDQGFLIATKINPSKEENLDALRKLFADLALAGPFTIPIDFTPDVKEKDAIAAFEAELGDINLPELIDLDALGIELSAAADEINNTFGSIAYNEKLEKDLASIDISGIVGDIFARGGDAQRKELEAQAETLKSSLKSGQITYQEYAQEIGLIQKKLGTNTSTLENIFASAGAGLSAGLGVAIDNLRPAFEDLAKRIENGSATIGDSLKLVGQEASLQFAKLIADGENVGTALLKSVGATAQKLLALYIPEILALFSATIPPPFGFIAGAAAVASLQALLATAMSGFEEGGFTGGREGEVRGVVHGAEYVANARTTRRERALFQFLDNGGTSDEYFRRFATPDLIPKTRATTVDNSGAMVSVLMDVRDRLDRIPNESFMKHGVSVDVGLDTVLYQKQQHRNRVRGLR